MRLLHTSDWHLGRTLHRADLREAQAGFLDSLVETVRRERVDVVLVAGDVYDRAIPPVDAVALCSETLSRLRAAGARVVVSSGNHDSACRLGFGAELVDAAGVHLRTSPAAVARPVELADEHGPVAVYAVPYLEPDAVRASLPLPAPPAAGSPGETGRDEAPPGDDLRGHGGVLRRAAECIRADLAARGGPRSVVLAHAWVTGGATCDSERDITVGGVGAVGASTFAGFTYTALGHLHRQQVLGPALRYSGSPLPYSFSEAGQPKGCWLVELGAAGVSAVERVPAPTLRPLAAVRDTLAELLGSRRYAGVEDHFLSVTLTDPARPAEAMTRLRSRFPHVLLLSWEPAGGSRDEPDYRRRLRGLDDEAVTASFLDHVRGAGPSAAEQVLLRAALEAGRRGGAEGSEPAAVLRVA